MKTLEQPQLAEATAENVFTIATHDGVAHADDVFAVATVLRAIGLHLTPPRVIRTRDPKLLAAADIVIDVGGVHDADTHRFDHHQAGGAGCRANGVPYASFGLVWVRYGHAACFATLKDTCDFDDTFAIATAATFAVDASLVVAVDANDTGHAKSTGYSISAAIAAFNPRWCDDQSPGEFDRRFAEALKFADGTLVRAIFSAAAEARAVGEVDAAIQASKEWDDNGMPGEILVLERYVPWQERVTRSDEGLALKFVVFPAVDGSWRAQTIQVYAGLFQPVRWAFPKTWWGLRGDQMDEVTGLPGATFCHTNGFTLGHATKDGAIALAELALHIGRNPGGAV